ncbi:uncharacterized protein LOC143377325 [Andrena cerasifolii]|uniref:uncharacterized protein LOC143377325 n=1 Tax=Andrena cerasifolii TaxID=2819439 RepID=UPI004037A675
MDTLVGTKRAAPGRTEADSRKEELAWTQEPARERGAEGCTKGEELLNAAGITEDTANKRGCKSAAQVWMSLLSICDRMCSSAAWLVLITCFHGVRFLQSVTATFCPEIPCLEAARSGWMSVVCEG